MPQREGEAESLKSKERKASAAEEQSVERPALCWLGKACEKGSGVASNTVHARCVKLSMQHFCESVNS